MRKYIITVCLFLPFCYLANAQSWEEDMVTARRMADSLKQQLTIVKGDKKIDCLNLLAETFFWIWDEDDKVLDTACIYTDQAYELAKKSNYKRGLGYATRSKAHCFAGRTDNNINNNNTETNYKETEKWAEEAIKIGEELKDYRLVGDVYDIMKWMERWKGSRAKYKSNVEKAIYYYEKPVSQKLTGLLDISDCIQCQGNEKLLGGLYQTYAEILGSELEDVNKIKSQIDKAIFYYTKIDNKWGLAVAYQSLGQTATQIINLETGINYLSKAVTLFRQVNNSRGELGVLRDLCSAYWNMGDFENGLKIARTGLALGEKLMKNNAGSGDSLRLAQAYYWVARFYEIAGDYSTSFAYFNKAHSTYPSSQRNNAQIMVALGDMYRKIGNYDSAKVYLMQFEKRDGGKPMLANLYVSLKQYDDAIRIFDLVKELPVNRNNNLGWGRNYLILANAHLGKNNLEQALTNARRGVELLAQTKRNVYLPDGFKVLSDVFEKLGKTDSAFYYFKKFSSLKDSLLNRQFYFQLSDYKKQAEEESKTSQINILNKDNQLKNQQLKQQAQLRNFLLLGLLALSLIAAFIYRNLSLKRKNDKLKNEQIHAQLKQRTSELEMQALRAQMNPHFIFNCLSSINRFILKNETEAASDYLTRFSRLIRMVLIHSQSERIVLKDELEMLRLYLDMEQLRFKNTFDYNISFTNSIDPEMIFIPPLLLQPFCENAIWHGLMHKEERGYLEIELSLHNDYLNCIISDNGIGRKKAAEVKSHSGEMHKSVGLKITAERLALMNQENSSNTSYQVEDIVDWDGNIAGTRVNLNIRVKDRATETVKETA